MLWVWRIVCSVVVVMAVGAGAFALAQFGRNVVYQNDPPQTEFVFARWQYSTGFRGDGWAHDYPDAEEHLLQVMTETTIVDVDRMSYRIVQLASDEIFDYPFSYISEPGEMNLTDHEVDQLREYINRGGFIMVDDFGGQGQGAWEFNTFRDNLRRVFPDRELEELSINHPIFKSLYEINSVNAVHPMTGSPSIFMGYPDGRGGLAMIVCYSSDIGDFWEYIDSPYYPAEPSAEALKLGLNFIQYGMTH